MTNHVSVDHRLLHVSPRTTQADRETARQASCRQPGSRGCNKEGVECREPGARVMESRLTLPPSVTAALRVGLRSAAVMRLVGREVLTSQRQRAKEGLPVTPASQVINTIPSLASPSFAIVLHGHLRPRRPRHVGVFKAACLRYRGHLRYFITQSNECLQPS